MFFYLSKFFWFFVSPGNVLLIALCLGAVLIYRRRDKVGRWLISFAALLSLGAAVLPIGKNLYVILENRFPVVHELPKKVDGIIVLGGVVNEVITKFRGQISIGGAIERLTEFATLSRRYPDAKLIFTGGSGKILSQNIKETDVIAPLLTTMGIDLDRVLLESQSRNTYENAVMSLELAKPAPDETWVLITSAFHMPRSVGIFRKIGWNVLPYPVDFNTSGEVVLVPSFNLISGLSYLSGSFHEWIGLLFYWMTNKTDALFPAPKT